jgi:histidinol-phosphatase
VATKHSRDDGSSAELEELLEFADRLARAAGAIALSHFGKDISRERKRDGTIVTAADREAEQYMRRRIAERYPSDGIIGEEFGIRQGTSNRRWVIDPIDGTFSYARGVPLFGVLVGVEISGTPSVGVAHMPALDETAAAAVGLGCSWNGTRAMTSKIGTLGDALIVCGDFYASHTLGFGEAVERIQAAAGGRRGWGDCYGHILVATGRADVALDPVMSIWDCAALAPIVEEAGGTFTDWRGRRTIQGGNAIATNGPLFDDVMALVRASL